MSRANRYITSLREWAISVPKRWWEVLGIYLTYIPLLGGVIGFAVWARRIDPPLPWWNVGLAVGGALLFLVVSFLAFHRVREERDAALESQKGQSRLAVKPVSGRRQSASGNLHLMWAGLEVTNTDPTMALRNVEVQITACHEVLCIREQEKQEFTYHLCGQQEDWTRVNACWSESEVTPRSTKVDIPQRATRTAIIAFQDNPNGGTVIYNGPMSNKPTSAEAKIEVEVSSPDSILWKKSYYIQCHPNYVDGTLARFDFAEWDTWMRDHKVFIEPSSQGHKAP